MKASLRVILAAGLAATVAMAGCSKPESRLIGKWVGQSGTIEFFANKSGVISPRGEVTGLPANVRFHWDMPAEDSVRIELSQSGGKSSLGKLVDKKVLVVEDDRFLKAI